MPGTMLSFIFVVVVTLSSSFSWMGFDNEYGTVSFQEVADHAFGLEVPEAMKEGIHKIIHRGWDF